MMHVKEGSMKLESCSGFLRWGRPDGNQCLQATEASDGTSPSVQHKACDTNNAQQLITPLALPSIMWNMHKDADRTTGEDLHQAYSSYCGAHGALASLSFGQIFGGITNGEKSTCQFAPVIKFGVFVDSTITYDKTSSSWPNWNTLLADSPILCPDGEALTGFKHQPASNKFRYECSRIGRTRHSWQNQERLIPKKLIEPVACPKVLGRRFGCQVRVLFGSGGS